MVHSASVPLCGGHSTCVTVVVCSPLLHFLLSSPPTPNLSWLVWELALASDYNFALFLVT